MVGYGVYISHASAFGLKIRKIDVENPKEQINLINDAD